MVRRHITEDGRFKLPDLPGPDWVCEESSTQPGLPVAFVRCHRTSWGDKFSILAKEYGVRPDQVHSAEKLCNQIYKSHYEQSFARIQYLRRGPITHQGVLGYEIELDALVRPGVSIRILERVLVKGTQVLSLHASGPPMEYRKAQGAIRLWFTESIFQALEEEEKGGVWL